MAQAQQEIPFTEATPLQPVRTNNMAVTVRIAGAVVSKVVLADFNDADRVYIACGYVTNYLKEGRLDPYKYLSWLLKTTKDADLTDAKVMQTLLPWNAPAECRVK